jgi:hypothetical protein
MEQTPSWESKLVKKFLTFYENRRLITVCRKARHWSPTWATRIQSHLPILFR